MVDKLQVDLVAGNAPGATADVQKFKNTVVAANTEVNALATKSNTVGQQFSKKIADVERQALNLDFTLRKIASVSIGTPGIDGLGKAAVRAQAELQTTYNRLRQSEQAAGVTKDPLILKALQAEAIKTSAELDRLQNKINRVGAGRTAAAERVAANAGPGGRAVVGQGLNAAALAGVPFANEASAALAGAAELGISAGALASFGALAAIGVVLVKQSQTIREEAERKQKAEFAIAASVNRQIIAGQQLLADAKKAREETAFQRQLQADIAAQSVTELQNRRDLALKINSIDPSNGNFDRNEQIAAASDAAIAQRRQDAQSKQDASFNQRNEDFKKNQADTAAFEKKKLQERIESINAGRSKVAEFGKSIDDLFARLFAQAGDKNPFVKVFDEATASIEKTTLSTAGLSEGLRKQAEDMVKAQNANALFSARLENSLNAVNLRADAQNFRVGGKSNGPESDADFEARINRVLQKQGFNPQDFKNFTVKQRANFATANTAVGFDDLAALQSRAASAAALARNGLQRFTEFQDATSKFNGFDISNGRFNGVKLDDLANGTALNNAQKADQNLSAQDRLNRQLAVINNANPENEAQRADADRKIIAITQGLNPDDLTGSQRDAAAGAREREAARLEGAETAARAQREEQTNVQKSIDKNIADLLKIAQTDGLTGVIRIINEAEDNARETLGKRKRVGDKDVKDLMD